MKTKTLCFSQNFDDTAVKMKDYMNHYLSETMGKTGYIYDKEVAFSTKEDILKAEMKQQVEALAGVNFSDSDVAQSLFAKHPSVKWAAMAVVESLIDMILPDVLVKEIGMFVDFRNLNAGDSAAFHIKPNDLFYVSKAGRNQRVTEFQRQFDSTTTIIPEVRALTVDANLYRIICGMDSLADLVMKAVLSLETLIRKEVYGSLNAAMLALPSTPADGALKVTGYTKPTAIKLAQTVQAYNNGMKPIFVGTKLALSKILPTDSNFRYEETSSLFKLGYIPTPFGYDCFELEQVADWADKYKLVLDDTTIYVISPGAGKLIKFVYEGIPMESTVEANESADRTTAVCIQKSYGFAVATNATAGVIVVE